MNIAITNNSLITSLYASLKLTMLSFLILHYILMTATIRALFFFSKNLKRRILPYVVSLHAKVVLKLLGVKVNYQSEQLNRGLDSLFNQNSDFKGTGSLVVCNHLSYLDIIITAARYPLNFVTSLEVKESFLGLLFTEGAQCLYVNRKDRTQQAKEREEIFQGISSGLNICFYPEGTSGNGEQVLPFKRSLYKSVEFQPVKITPLCLEYTDVNGAPISRANRDKICWYADMTFWDHLFDMCKLTTINANLKTLSAIHCIHHDADELRQITYELINSNYTPVR